MNSIKPGLPPALSKIIDPDAVAHSPALHVPTYRALVGHVAQLAYRNPTQVLFFRGQNTDFTVGARTSSFYPAIYRGEYLPHEELGYRFELLQEAGRQLLDRLQSEKLDGLRDLTRRRYVRWAILQHYGVCATPLFDVTHSLRVACSFAEHGAASEPFVYVFGLPALTHRITIDSESDVVVVRLLSICPPDALRPYFQEGYLVGTPDIEGDYEEKSELDLRNRLIAKFQIAIGRRFWGSGFNAIPESVLLPRRDHFKTLCEGIRVNIPYGLRSGDIGEFLAKWVELEEALLSAAESHQERALSARAAIQTLSAAGIVTEGQRNALEQLRRIRNDVVHRPQDVEPTTAKAAVEQLEVALKTLLPLLRKGSRPGRGAS